MNGARHDVGYENGYGDLEKIVDNYDTSLYYYVRGRKFLADLGYKYRGCMYE